MRDIAYAFGLDDANGESPQSRDIFRAGSSAYPAAVLVIVPIDNVMTAVFDTPVATVGGKHALRVGLIRGTAGNAIGKFTGIFTGFFICGLPLDEKRLADVRKVQIAIEFGGGPDLSNFDPAVIRWITMDKIGFLSVMKI